MELVLYYIQESRWLLISFLVLVFALGVFGYVAIRNFRQDKKSKIFFYGLFLRLKNVLDLSIIPRFRLRRKKKEKKRGFSVRLEGKSLKSDFLKFIIPYIIAQWVFSVYTMVDGIFVARGVS